MSEDNPIVIVGAGQAGLQVADSLRRAGYEGDIQLLGDEPTLPYQRPPLSKQFMNGELSEDRLLFRPATYYEKQRIDVRLDARVEALDPDRHVVVCGGREIKYSKLALTTGATVRKLPVPGADLDGVYYLRSLADARTIRQRLEKTDQRVVAIGGGFIGLELAASARELGHRVTVIEAMDRLMGRAVSPLISNYYLDLHTAHGVDIRLNCAVQAISTDESGALSVETNEGRLPADLIVVGIGSIPHTALAEDAGLKCDNGIVVDEFAQTSDIDIVAAGDCTNHRNLRNVGWQRLESVQNAVDQAKIAALSLTDTPQPYDQVAWFWSDQFDAKLQMTGTALGHDRHTMRGDPGERHIFCILFSR